MMAPDDVAKRMQESLEQAIAESPQGNIARFKFIPGEQCMSDPLGNRNGQFVSASDGPYMFYKDHIAILNRKAPPNSIEDLAEVTLDRIAEFFGKCVNQPEFCGFSVEETEDAFGNPVGLTLTACEMVGGEPLRKVAKV